MAAVTICSDFGAQENKVSHCFSIYLPWSDGARDWNAKVSNAEEAEVERFYEDLQDILELAAKKKMSFSL